MDTLRLGPGALTHLPILYRLVSGVLFFHRLAPSQRPWLDSPPWFSLSSFEGWKDRGVPTARRPRPDFVDTGFWFKYFVE